MIWILCLVPAWWFSFHVIFPGMLNYRRLDAVWPRDAFARCLAIFWGLSWLVFLLLFAGISDELRLGGSRLFPAGWFGNLVNVHWPWIIIFLGVVLSALLILWIFRSQESPQSSDE